MSKLLIKLFVKDYKNTSDAKVRRSYGNLASIFGIITNVFVCLLKLIVGFIFGLISLVADGLNNLTDASSSIISLVGFKLSAKPADKDHPYGHARIEYIAGFIVSIIVVVLGIQLIVQSVTDIINCWGEPYQKLNDTFLIVTIIVLSVSILAKIYQGLFYYKIGKRINSGTLCATAIDSRNDVIATSVVLIGIIISQIFNFYIDGYLGCAVGIFICYSGFKLIKETSNPLISETIDPELTKKLINKVKSYPEILGIHDLQIHAYGPSTFFATMHVEVDSTQNILEIHDLIDNIEKECQKEYNILTTLHMDPVVLNDPLTTEIKAMVIPEVMKNKNVLSIHDFRIVKGPTHINVVFDVMIKQEAKISDEALKNAIEQIVISLHDDFVPVITIDHDFNSY